MNTTNFIVKPRLRPRETLDLTGSKVDFYYLFSIL